MKKYLKLGLIVFGLIVFGFVGVKVFAESNSVNAGPRSLSSSSPMVVNIGPSGNVLMRGIVVGAPGTDSIVVKSWGGSWKVSVTSTTQLMSSNKLISDFQNGDFVGVLGTISSDGSFIIDAKIIREWRTKTEHEKMDADNDGIPNSQDSDDDNDGVLDANDPKPLDHDDDGILDSDDSDDDDDGVDDNKEEDKHGDHDNDGIVDSRDNDDDNDGISDILDSKDHDNDGSDDDTDSNDEDSSGSGRDGHGSDDN